MKREIKFKVWDKSRRVFLGTINLPFITEMETRILDERGFDIEFLEYVGMKDRNFIEIYEGDIVRVTKEKPESIMLGETGIVAWEGCGFRVTDLPPYDWDVMSPSFALEATELEIIGNIRQNLEFLKNEKQV